ncbi:MAG TPA: fibronectin type III domain-containing protein [Solirubrobacteraceae bacterium]|nr:fibronectin type III domain-containing protein [Solirubrobacteraceae bacterium]
MHRLKHLSVTLFAVFALTALSAAPALASSSPTVETRPATWIGETNSTLNGIVNPNGAETKYYFEYGTTVSYGTKTAEASAGSGTKNVEESKEITGLLASTTYHFRIVATNSNGTSAGADQMFKTGANALPKLHPAPTPAQPLKFTFTAGPSTIEMTSNTQIDCASGTGTGSFVGAKTGSAKLTFKECKLPAGLNIYSCGSGQEAGVIVTEKLPITLVYTAKEPSKEVAVAFNYKGGTYTSFTCQSEEAVVRHAILAPITPLNTLTKEFTVKFNTENRIQTPRSNFNEELTGMESSFPEAAWFGGYSERFGWAAKTTLNSLKVNGASVEEQIEA